MLALPGRKANAVAGIVQIPFPDTISRLAALAAAAPCVTMAVIDGTSGGYSMTPQPSSRVRV